MIINQAAREAIPSQNSVYVRGQFPWRLSSLLHAILRCPFCWAIYGHMLIAHTYVLKFVHIHIGGLSLRPLWFNWRALYNSTPLGRVHAEGTNLARRQEFADDRQARARMQKIRSPNVIADESLRRDY